MSKKGKTLVITTLALLFISLALLIFGRTGKVITAGFIGLGLTVVLLAIMRVIASYNRAKLQRRAYDDLHKMAENSDKKNDL